MTEHNSQLCGQLQRCNCTGYARFYGHGRDWLIFQFDADRGFHQIVMTEEAVQASAFEMLGSLWVSERMLFGMKNGPPVFKRNAVEMLGHLRDGVAKAYFDDIIGKAAKRDHITLGNVWEALLQAMRDYLTELRCFLGRDAMTLPGMIELVSEEKWSVKMVTPMEHLLVEACVDEHSMIKDDDDVVTPLPIYHLSAQEYIEKEVFTVPKLSAEEVKKPTQENEKEDKGESNVLEIGIAIDVEMIEKILEGEKEMIRIAEEEAKKAYWAPVLPAVWWAYRYTPHVKTKINECCPQCGGRTDTHHM